MTHFTSYRWAGAAVAAFALFATAVAGQPPRPAPADPIDTAKARQKIADEKAQAEVLEAIKLADGLAKTSPARAVDTLKKAQTNIVDLSVSISGDTRKQLNSLLDGRITAYGGKPANPGPAVKFDPTAPAIKTANAEAAAKYFAELKDVREGIKLIEKAQLDGKTNEANYEIARLTKLYPTNPSVVVLGQKESIQDRLAGAQAHYVESNKRWVANQININKSSLPAIMDVEFPANWKEISERRLKSSTVQMSAKEKQIIEALDKPVSINFADRPLEEALQDLSNMLDQPLLIDKKSVEDLLVDLKKGVSLQAKGLSARTVLRSILSAQGLTFVVKDETIQIVTVEKSKNLLTTRVYYLGDLVKGVGPFSAIEWGPVANLQQSQANVAAIIDAVKQIDPLSWNDKAGNGGVGTVTFHTPTMSLIVRNSAEVHFSLSRSLGSGR